jgi:hypothetical protein
MLHQPLLEDNNGNKFLRLEKWLLIKDQKIHYSTSSQDEALIIADSDGCLMVRVDVIIEAGIQAFIKAIN